MSTLAERLQTAMDRAGLNRYRLGKDSGVDLGAITRILQGKASRLEHGTLAALAKRCSVRMEWLSSGEGPMLEAGGPRLLRERAEWPELLGGVRQFHPDLEEPDLAAVGEMYDSPGIFPAALDVPAVAALAVMHRDWARRTAARQR